MGGVGVQPPHEALPHKNPLAPLRMLTCRPSTVSRTGVGAVGQRRWGGERTVRGVPKAFWSVHGAPQPLSSWLWTAWAGGRA